MRTTVWYIVDHISLLQALLVMLVAASSFSFVIANSEHFRAEENESPISAVGAQPGPLFHSSERSEVAAHSVEQSKVPVGSNVCPTKQFSKMQQSPISLAAQMRVPTIKFIGARLPRPHFDPASLPPIPTASVFVPGTAIAPKVLRCPLWLHRHREAVLIKQMCCVASIDAASYEPVDESTVDWHIAAVSSQPPVGKIPRGQSIEEWQLPSRLRRQPISAQECAAINVSTFPICILLFRCYAAVSSQPPVGKIPRGQSIEEWQLPSRLRRQPISAQECAAINGVLPILRAPFPCHLCKLMEVKCKDSLQTLWGTTDFMGKEESKYV
uniref:FZ domain-containing protein n=1 Tax=Ascaris lumbricoides TaxID=6252 RepID=A0A9J2PC25_ASCLU